MILAELKNRIGYVWGHNWTALIVMLGCGYWTYNGGGWPAFYIILAWVVGMIYFRFTDLLMAVYMGKTMAQKDKTELKHLYNVAKGVEEPTNWNKMMADRKAKKEAEAQKTVFANESVKNNNNEGGIDGQNSNQEKTI